MVIVYISSAENGFSLILVFNVTKSLTIAIRHRKALTSIDTSATDNLRSKLS